MADQDELDEDLFADLLVAILIWKRYIQYRTC
jgi:hypothetical protein